jgi:predicted dehydrogenase
VKERPLNVALIGYGYWGPNLARVFSDIPNVTFHTLCDRSEARLQLARTKYQRLNTCQDPREVFENPSIDAVLIATPVSTHAPIAQNALRANKHVYVEKPLTMRYRDAVACQRLAHERRRILMVGHTFLYSPPVKKVKELIQDGTLGKVYYLNSQRVNLGLFQPDVSVFWDLAPHDLSIFVNWLDADPVWVSAQGNSFVRRDILEVGFATLGFPNGVLAHLHVSWLAPTKLRHTTVVGSKRMVLYDDTSNNEKVKVFDQGVVRNPETFGEFQLTYRSGDVLSPHLPALEPLYEQAKAFISAIRTGKAPASSGAFGSRVVRILESIEASSKKHGRVYRLR